MRAVYFMNINYVFLTLPPMNTTENTMIIISLFYITTVIFEAVMNLACLRKN